MSPCSNLNCPLCYPQGTGVQRISSEVTTAIKTVQTGSNKTVTKTVTIVTVDVVPFRPFIFGPTVDRTVTATTVATSTDDNGIDATTTVNSWYVCPRCTTVHNRPQSVVTMHLDDSSADLTEDFMPRGGTYSYIFLV